MWRVSSPTSRIRGSARSGAAGAELDTGNDGVGTTGDAVWPTEGAAAPGPDAPDARNSSNGSHACSSAGSLTVRPWCPPGRSDPGLLLAGPGVDADDVALGHEQRHLDHETGLH